MINIMEFMNSNVIDVMNFLNSVTHFKVDGKSREISGYVCVDITNNEIEVQVFEEENADELL